MTTRSVSFRQRFLDRIQKLMGSDLSAHDFSFLKNPVPVTELERLKDFTSVNSATLEKAGVAQMQDKVSAILERVGFKIRTVNAEDRFAHLVIAERPGRSNKFITLITHVDTVLSNFKE